MGLDNFGIRVYVQQGFQGKDMRWRFEYPLFRLMVPLEMLEKLSMLNIALTQVGVFQPFLVRRNVVGTLELGAHETVRHYGYAFCWIHGCHRVNDFEFWRSQIKSLEKFIRVSYTQFC